MTSENFRNIALSMPGAVEAGHMQHPDFRINGKIFATLGYPNADFGMLKLAPEEQSIVVAAEPHAYEPATGAWGRNGSTLVRLHAAADAVLRQAMLLAYDGVRSKSVPRSKVAKKT